ncbi:MAG: maleylacetoacetate isomerase [Deltaproteobacteria bacterium]|nr:maleylacetoacetate isomerase [Deltaproteobacteria bacterium]
MTRYRLHGYFRSSATYRVRIALGLKGLSWETAPVHLVRGGGEQHGEAYRRLNPMREVPALELLDADGQTTAVLAQSVAILEYLDEVHPDPPLLPATPLLRARCRQLVEAVNSSIQPVQNLRVLLHLERALGADKAQVHAWAAHFIARGFEGLEPLLAQTAGRFAMGDAPTLADVVLVPQVFNARRFSVDLAPFPTIARVEASASQLDAFQAASPERQPDAE